MINDNPAILGTEDVGINIKTDKIKKVSENIVKTVSEKITNSVKKIDESFISSKTNFFGFEIKFIYIVLMFILLGLLALYFIYKYCTNKTNPSENESVDEQNNSDGDSSQEDDYIEEYNDQEIFVENLNEEDKVEDKGELE